MKYTEEDALKRVKDFKNLVGKVVTVVNEGSCYPHAASFAKQFAFADVAWAEHGYLENGDKGVLLDVKVIEGGIPKTSLAHFIPMAAIQIDDEFAMISCEAITLAKE